MLIPACDKVLVDVGVAFQIPMGYYGWIASRSGLAIHHHIHVGAGVVNPDYTGSYSCVADELQFSEPCNREESSDSPDDSRKKWLVRSFVRYHKCSQQSVVPKDLAPWGNKTY